MDSLTLGFSAAMIMGLAFGAGPCNITCLPYLGPVFLGQEKNNMRTSWKTIIPFSLGRLTGYTLLGTIAGSFGLAATTWIEEGIAAQVLGVATILAGLYLLFGTLKKKSCASHHASHQNQVTPVNFVKPDNDINKSDKSTLYLTGSLFTMGTGMALNPCIPLVTILTVAATMATPVDGARLGVAFGLGAVVVPTLFFGFAVAYFSQQIKVHLSQWGKTLERISGFMLIFLGGFTALGWIQP
ncbi:MAG: sulfite exporter TauE/SafE family protein [gamma proteobacterium symbiont of Bathyaustriella thionipta]|nr:sulfite exporter TauE/SafE family protein [gamma proteobacterium symbiont of Bathyaustriella thionipta]MCU7950760.1 sulfite exporter TauE/SafE family protein [gamma proteobacterium symbiont of Bathyaustriella thionipta]MCU7952760.1 sulfite exporter TauE/SafE family protein [gamma proteobacterium symbiont of Bathyaustriella thionipta]MCU7957260.1 sulfite exporter TauE/SafE family protein [gamma proteobacterium symbiont of Bathyaustriella thionipta]MCU7968509.1 sulfite exporter TauE/SafE famil